MGWEKKKFSAMIDRIVDFTRIAQSQQLFHLFCGGSLFGLEQTLKPMIQMAVN